MIPVTVVSKLIDGKQSDKVAKKGKVSLIHVKKNGKRDFKSLLNRGIKNIKLELTIKLEDFIKKLKRYIGDNYAGSPNINISETDRKNLIKLIDRLLDKIAGTTIQGNSQLGLSKERILEIIKLVDSLKKELSKNKELSFPEVKELIAFIEQIGSEIGFENNEQSNPMSRADELQINLSVIEQEKSIKRKVTIIDRRNSDKNNSESKINVKSVSNKTHASESTSFLKTDLKADLKTEIGFLGKTATGGPSSSNNSSHDEVSSNSNLQNIMEKVKEVISNKIFKTGVIVVKEDGNGEIRFQLKPESLGNIRMRLTIDKNHIVGKIIVENNSVRNILDNNMDSLRNALKDNGFQTASFEVSVDNKFSDSMNGKSENKEFKEGKIKISAIEEIEKTIPRFWDLSGNDLLVDLIV